MYHDGLQLMKENNIVNVLLPTTAYTLQIERPPARKTIDNMIVLLHQEQILIQMHMQIESNFDAIKNKRKNKNKIWVLDTRHCINTGEFPVHDVLHF